jgi:hypothetical protein
MSQAIVNVHFQYSISDAYTLCPGITQTKHMPLWVMHIMAMDKPVNIQSSLPLQDLIHVMDSVCFPDEGYVSVSDGAILPH